MRWAVRLALVVLGVFFALGFRLPPHLVLQTGDSAYPVGPITSRAAFVQEVNVTGPMRVASLEVLLATWGKPANTTHDEIRIFDGSGGQVQAMKLPPGTVADNAYVRVDLPHPIAIDGQGRFFVSLSSSDGSKADSITAWATPASEAGRLYSLRGADLSQGSLVAMIDAARPLKGAICVRVFGQGPRRLQAETALRVGGLLVFLALAACVWWGVGWAIAVQRRRLSSEAVQPDTESSTVEGIRAIGWRARAVEVMRLKRVNVTLAAVCAVYFGVCAWYSDVVPMWDSRIYFDALLNAVLVPFDLSNFAVAAHPTMAYMLVLAPTQYIDPGNVVLLTLANAGLGVASLCASYVVLVRIVPSTVGRVEIGLAVGLLAFHPMFLAGTVSLNPDFGVLVFLTIVMALLLSRHYVLAMVFAIALVFSKESGTLLYAAALALVALVQLPAKWRHKRPWVVATVRRAYLLAPIVCYFSWIKYQAYRSDAPPLWGGTSSSSILRAFLSFDFSNRTIQAYFIGIFVVSFAWVLTVVLALCCAVGVQRLAQTVRIPGGHGGQDAAMRGFTVVSLLFIAATYALTRIPTYLNLRYFLPVYGLMMLVLGASVLRVLGRRPRWVRIGLLASLIALLLIASFRTVDPVSMAVFGTFKFGRHDMLRMTSFTGEPVAYGRDQLVYNLQFTNFHYMQNAVYEGVRASAQSVVTMDPEANFYLAGPLLSSNRHRSARPKGVFVPIYSTPTDVLRVKPALERFCYIRFPNFDNRDAVRQLSRRYLLDHSRVFWRRGYALRVDFWKRQE